MYWVEDLTINATIAGAREVESEELTDLGPSLGRMLPIQPRLGN